MHFVTRAEMQADHTLLEYKRHCIVLALPCSIGFYPPTRGDFVVNKVDFEQLVTLSSTSAEMLTSNQRSFSPFDLREGQFTERGSGSSRLSTLSRTPFRKQLPFPSSGAGF